MLAQPRTEVYVEACHRPVYPSGIILPGMERLLLLLSLT